MSFGQKVRSCRNMKGPFVSGKLKQGKNGFGRIHLRFSKELLTLHDEVAFDLQYGENEDRGKMLMTFSQYGSYKWGIDANVPLCEYIKSEHHHKSIIIPHSYDKDDNCIYLFLPKTWIR